MIMMRMKVLFLLLFIIFNEIQLSSHAQSNPFLRPGSQNRKPTSIVKPAPPPPSPKPVNSNLELRGFFKFEGTWHFALFDKVKNKGYWLKKGESFDDGKVQIESFNPETEVVKMKGGQTLSLKASEHKVMPVPSAQPVKKKNTTASTKSPIRLPNTNLPRVKIPPRKPRITTP